jgi:hypothetical protein
MLRNLARSRQTGRASHTTRPSLKFAGLLPQFDEPVLGQ